MIEDTDSTADAGAAGSTGSTADSGNVALFATLAADWWDPDGASKLLHRINPVRLGYMRDRAIAHFGLDPRARRALAGLFALDVGCGGGLVAEPLARMGAAVTGLDAGADVIAAARAHAEAQSLAIRYEAGDLIAFSHREPAAYDILSCLEVVEHVTDLEAFLLALARLLKPGGLLLFSTPNRTPQSWAVLIAGAERITRLIPKGGHDWKQFLTPAELTQKLGIAGLRVEDVKGMGWSVASGFRLSDDPSITYIGSATRV